MLGAVLWVEDDEGGRPDGGPIERGGESKLKNGNEFLVHVLIVLQIVLSRIDSVLPSINPRK